MSRPVAARTEVRHLATALTLMPALLLLVIAALPLQGQMLASAVEFRPSFDTVPLRRVVPDSLVRAEEQQPPAPGGFSALHHALQNAGFTLWGSYVADASANLRGGTQRGTAGRALLTTGLTMDLDRLVGLGGGSLEVASQLHDGNNGSDLVGDVQAFSNIDAPAFAHVHEIYYVQQAGERLRFRTGRMDANSEFAVVGPAGEFINSSAGFSPTIYGLPTYPMPQYGLDLAVRPAGWLELAGGGYRSALKSAPRENAPDRSAFGIGEVRLNWSGDAGRAVVGYWRHSGHAPTFADGWQQAPQGWYASLEQRVGGTAGDDTTAASGTMVFAKYGSGDGRVNPFARHVMVGFETESPLSLGGHAIGFLLSHVDLSDEAGATTPGDETAFELFYRLPVTGNFTLRPDLQFIIAPSGSGASDAFVSTLRLELGF